MRTALLLVLLNGTLWGQSGPAFEVASVKASQRVVGPDANNHLVSDRAGITARNATLRRLLAEAYRVQVSQVLGPKWLDQNEYEVEAKAGRAVRHEELDLMLQTLLSERFRLVQHRETREMRLYELMVDKGGPKIHPLEDGQAAVAGAGFHFHGYMQRFADLLAVQLSIALPDDPTRPGVASGSPVPVLDRTGLQGTYEFGVDVRPEPGADIFTLWQRTLREKLGLRLESRKGSVEVIVVDRAEKVPAAN